MPVISPFEPAVLSTPGWPSKLAKMYWRMHPTSALPHPPAMAAFQYAPPTGVGRLNSVSWNEPAPLSM